LDRTFSVLKIIKTYYRFTHGQDRLTYIRIILIEKYVLEDLKMSSEFYDKIIEKFVEKGRIIDLFIY